LRASSAQEIARQRDVTRIAPAVEQGRITPLLIVDLIGASPEVIDNRQAPNIWRCAVIVDEQELVVAPCKKIAHKHDIFRVMPTVEQMRPIEFLIDRGDDVASLVLEKGDTALRGAGIGQQYHRAVGRGMEEGSSEGAALLGPPGGHG